MGIKIVVNGYFRSGTTFLWGFLKDSLKEHSCYYEPLHPDLSNAIRRETYEKKENKIHKSYLWQEYIKLDKEKINEILRNNPNVNLNGIKNDEEVLNYFNIFDKLKNKTLLQPNRLHFHLDLISKKYNPKIIHVIRHPLDVYLSMNKMYYNVCDNSGQKILKWILKSIIFQRASGFNLNKEYNWIIKYTGYPLIKHNNWITKYFNWRDNFGKFLVIWTISNYYAIKAVENIKVNYNTPVIKKGNYYKFNPKQIKKVLKSIKKYQIEKEFNYIIKKLDKEGINYISLK